MEKKILKAYFENVGRLVCCRSCAASRELSREMIELLLDIFGRQELTDRCIEILNATEMLHTVMDCALLGAEGLPVPEEFRGYLDMKAQCLRKFDLHTPENFDRESLEQDAAQAAIRGNISAMRLSACMDWLSGNRNRAIRCWTVLAYTGERFAMQALEYAFGQVTDESAIKLWQSVRKICDETDSRFSLAVPKAYFDGDEQLAAETAQIILIIRNRCAELQGKALPMAMIQYAIDSGDDFSRKVRNLCHAAEPYPVMLVNQRRQENRKYGF